MFPIATPQPGIVDAIKVRTTSVISHKIAHEAYTSIESSCADQTVIWMALGSDDGADVAIAIIQPAVIHAAGIRITSAVSRSIAQKPLKAMRRCGGDQTAGSMLMVSVSIAVIQSSIAHATDIAVAPVMSQSIANELRLVLRCFDDFWRGCGDVRRCDI